MSMYIGKKKMQNGLGKMGYNNQMQPMPYAEDWQLECSEAAFAIGLLFGN